MLTTLAAKEKRINARGKPSNHTHKPSDYAEVVAALGVPIRACLTYQVMRITVY